MKSYEHFLLVGLERYLKLRNCTNWLEMWLGDCTTPVSSFQNNSTDKPIYIFLLRRCTASQSLQHSSLRLRRVTSRNLRRQPGSNGQQCDFDVTTAEWVNQNRMLLCEVVNDDNDVSLQISETQPCQLSHAALHVNWLENASKSKHGGKNCHLVLYFIFSGPKRGFWGSWHLKGCYEIMKRFDADTSSSSSPSSKRRRSASVTSDSGSERDVGGHPKGKSELLLTNLAMFPGEETTFDDSYSANGKSKERMRNVLNGKVCSCSRNCKKAFSFATIYNVCCTFWNLSKAAQDCILWGIQNQCSNPVAEGLASGSSSFCSIDSEGSSSSSEAESISSSSRSSISSTQTKHVNKWYIQGRFWKSQAWIPLVSGVIFQNNKYKVTHSHDHHHPKSASRYPSMSWSFLQVAGDWQLAAGSHTQHVPRGGFAKVWYLVKTLRKYMGPIWFIRLPSYIHHYNVS